MNRRDRVGGSNTWVCEGEMGGGGGGGEEEAKEMSSIRFYS